MERVRWGQHGAAFTLGVGASVTILGAALPWLHSGSRGRSSFDLVAVARRLGLSPEGWQGLALRLWPLVPLVCVLATVAAWWGRHSTAVALAVVGSGAAAWLSIEVRTARLAANLQLSAGPSVTLAGAVLLLAGAVVVLLRYRRAE